MNPTDPKPQVFSPNQTNPSQPVGTPITQPPIQEMPSVSVSQNPFDIPRPVQPPIQNSPPSQVFVATSPEPPSVQPKKMRPKLLIIMAVIALVLIGGGTISYFLLSSSKTVTYSENEETTDGSILDKFTANCGSKGCFDKKFASCSPAIATITESSQQGEVHMKINGPKNSGCNMTVYITGSNGVNNKSFTCNFDNSDDNDIESSLAETSVSSQTQQQEDCSGPYFNAQSSSE